MVTAELERAAVILDLACIWLRGTKDGALTVAGHHSKGTRGFANNTFTDDEESVTIEENMLWTQRRRVITQDDRDVS